MTAMMDPVRLIVPASTSDYYAGALKERQESYGGGDPFMYSRFDGLSASLAFLVAFLALRKTFNMAFAFFFRRPSNKTDAAAMDKVEEEAYTTIGGLALLALGWHAMQELPQCSVFGTSGCVRGWPLIPMMPSTVRYYNAELGWYLHLMLKHSLGLGLADSRSMDVHHISTVGLVVLSYLLNLHGFGLMIFSLLNLSSPILHLSKLANTLDLRRARVGLFAAFAAVFGVTRVVMFPYVVVRAAGVEAYTHIPQVADHPIMFGVWITFLGLLSVLAVMQGWWFAAVVKILRQAAGGDADAVRAEIRRRDFSKEAPKKAGAAGGPRAAKPAAAHAS